MRRPCDVRRLLSQLIVCLVALGIGRAEATPAVSMDVATGDVLYEQDATQLWFPASTTKLMTVYVALSAVRDHQIAMNTPLVVSARAHKMPPSKMGFPVGTQVTLDNALKMLMVRSANDIAITVAEGVAGSVEAFADDMNRAAAQLGMHESHFVNPNGLPASDHYSSARDMAVLARALYTEFPDQAGLFNLGELSLGAELIPNHNNLLGRYPGADGMKTGFTCAAGFNVVASAFREGRRVVVVVFGAPSVPMRTQKVAALFDRAFANIDRPTGPITALPASTVSGPPDMHNLVCHGERVRLIAQFQSEVQQLDQPLQPGGSGIGLSALNPASAMLFGSSAPNAPNAASTAGPMAERISTMPTPIFDPVPVHIGADPGYTGVVAQAREAHTPIGSGTPPVTAEAYAAPATQPVVGISPLKVDPTALPLRGRRGRLARVPHRGRVTMKAAAEAPKTKVLAGSEGEAPTEPAAAAKPHAKVAARHQAAPAKAKKAVAKKAEPAHKAAVKKPESKKVARAKSKADDGN